MYTKMELSKVFGEIIIDKDSFVITYMNGTYYVFSKVDQDGLELSYEHVKTISKYDSTISQTDKMIHIQALNILRKIEFGALEL